jgi:hypothetical protein
MSGLTVQPNVDQQVAMLSRTLISRPNIEKLVRMADLDLKSESKAQQDELIEGLMKKVSIKSTGRDNLYTLSYQEANKDKAKRVIQSMVSIFVESSLGASRKDTDSAKVFLDEQIKTYESKLEEAEGRLKEFRLRNIDLQTGDGKDSASRLAEMQVTAFQQNSNPTISKLSFLVGTDGASATEQMFITSNGLLTINGGANFLGGTGSFFNDITLTQTTASLSGAGLGVNSNRLVIKGNSWNSAQGNSPSMGYLQMITITNNANPTTDKLSFFVGSASSVNFGNVVGNATERIAIRTDGIFSYFNLAGTEFLRLVGSTGNILINTTTDVASSKLTINSTTQGFLPPRMTTAEKNAISSPATGLVVFDTTLGKLCVFATTWQTITST